MRIRKRERNRKRKSEANFVEATEDERVRVGECDSRKRGLIYRRVSIQRVRDEEME